MFSDNPFVESVEGFLTVWLGDLSELELEDYLDEPGGAGDNEPISNFSRDLDRWYDHDFIWVEGVDEAVSVKELCVLNGIDSKRLIEEIVERSDKKKIRSLLILWNSKKMEGAGERAFADGRLQCIGSWEHEPPLTD
ncbi:immunity 22 family protein [Microbulbifer sp. ZKSA006]|uniref:immunity 22 family protein n=1 Tax=Microbulbifer sp. ZKSA006 TaxID=3243390 RepID=UPI0040398265